MTTPSATIQSFDPLEPGLDSDPMTQLSRIFVYFLQNLFRSFPEGCGMRWMPDEKATEMLITAEKPRLETVEKVPHIVCILGSAQWSNLGHDQLLSLVMSTGARRHTDLMPMTVAYHCQARDGLHARRIAWNASFYTNVLRRIIMKQGHLHHVAPSHSISAESGPTAYVGPLANDEIVSVVVTVPFFWQPGWFIKDPSEILRKFNVTLNPQRVLPSRPVQAPVIRGRRSSAVFVTTTLGR